MLYEQWSRIALKRRSQIALRDLASNCRWTFGELFAAGEGQVSEESELVYPQGHDAGFILTLLAAWREDRVVCPLEMGQPPPVVPKPPKQCVHLKLTSATTGAARLVAFTANQLCADAGNIVATMGLRPDWPNLGVISMAHSYGFSNLVLPLLLHGIPLVLAPSPLPEIVRRAAADASALTLPAVPAMWRAWHEAGAISRNVRLAISAGAPLPVALEQTIFEAIGLKVHNFYGSSECGGIAYDSSGSPREDEAYAGAPMQNVRLSLGEDQCLIVHSRAVGETYWPEPLNTLSGGQFQTSDLAELKAHAVFLRGRRSDQINIAGRKVFPGAIERALVQHPAVNRCLVFGVPGKDVDRTDRIVACVRRGAPVSSEALRQFLLERLPAWQMPRDWWFVESLEENQVGKISRAEWRIRYERDRDQKH